MLASLVSCVPNARSAVLTSSQALGDDSSQQVVHDFSGSKAIIRRSLNINLQSFAATGGQRLSNEVSQRWRATSVNSFSALLSQ